MKVRIELELEGWMAKAVLEFAERLEKNWEDYKKRQREKEKANEEKESAEEKEGEKKPTPRQIRYELLKAAWGACNEVAKVERRAKEEIWDELKKEYGIESTKGMSNEELKKFVDFVKEKCHERITSYLV